MDNQFSETFYKAEVQAVLMFGLELWVLLPEMESTVEGTHIGFLKHITGKRAHKNPDGT